MYRRALRWMLGLAFCLLLTVSSCQSGGQAAQPGKWAGAGDQSFTIQFTVAKKGNALTSFSIGYTEECTPQSGFSAALRDRANIPIKEGKFELDGPTYHIVGRFITPDRAEGTWLVKAHHSSQFGTCREISGTWFAAPAATTAPPAHP